MIPILLISLTLAAGDTLWLDLEGAIEMALRNNLDYRVQALDNTTTKLSFYQSATSFLPKPMLQASYSQYQTRYGGIVPWQGYLIDLSITQPIVDIQKGAQVWGAKQGLDAGNAALEEAKNSLCYEVEALYLGILKAEKTLDMQTSALKRAEENLRLIQAKERLGQASRLDALNAKVALNQSKLALTTAGKNSRLARRLFLNVLGVAATPELLLAPPPPPELDSELLPLDTLITLAFGQRPSLRALRENLRGAKIGLFGQIAAVLPDLSFKWSWQYTDTVLPSIDDFRSETLRSSGITAGLSFDLLSYPIEVQKERKAVEKATAQLRRQQLLVAKEVEEAYLSYRAGMENVELAHLTLDAAREGEELAKAQFRLGLIKPLELFDAETNLLNAEADYLSALYDLHLARSGLRFAIGEKS